MTMELYGTEDTQTILVSYQLIVGFGLFMGLLIRKIQNIWFSNIAAIFAADISPLQGATMFKKLLISALKHTL